MKKIALFLALFFAFFASRWLFKPGYFLMHDDLQMMRQLQMEKCFQDRQIPCRWVPDMGYGYGYPLFNFYPPLPYYFGQIFRWLGFTFTATAKLLFILQFFLSAIAMFILASDLWGNWGGLLSAVFYTWAPYHAVDVFVRGAMNEVWAFVWFPLIFWAAKKLIESKKIKYLVWLAFSLAMLFLTHSLMVMIFVPMLGLWVSYWLWRFKRFSWRDWFLWVKLFGAGAWALGMAAFFVLPMFLEKKYVHLETMFSGYYDWRAHFVSLKQLFVSRFWGYGPSVWGPEDGMPFPVGHIHWALAVIIVSWLLLRFLRRQSARSENWLLMIGLFSLGLFYAFLAHQRSVPIWRLLPLLQMAQFPWRLLIGAAFLFSLLAGSIALFSRSRILVVLLCFLVTAFNWNYFKPKAMGKLTDAEKFSGKAWQLQQTASIYDYLPRSAETAPKAAPQSDWQFLRGVVGKFNSKKGTNWLQWQGRVEKPGWLEINVFYFPGWRVWVDEKPAGLEYEKSSGKMKVYLTEGKHGVYFRLTNTPIRAWANLFSLLSWWFLLMVMLRPKLWQLTPKN